MTHLAIYFAVCLYKASPTPNVMLYKAFISSMQTCKSTARRMHSTLGLARELPGRSTQALRLLVASHLSKHYSKMCILRSA